MNSLDPVRISAGARRASLLAAVGAMALGLGACQSVDQVGVVAAIPTDYRDNYPITIEESLATFDIPVGRETAYLARGMDGNIQAFANAFLNSGSSSIAIVLPMGAANSASAASIAQEVEAIFVSSGVPLGQIEYRSYPNSTPGDPPVRLAYVRLAATSPACGNWPTDLARNYQNSNYANFGCATQQNLAAMVANPLDLLYPRMLGPPSAIRRSTALDAYQQGNTTATPFPAPGNIANVP